MPGPRTGIRKPAFKKLQEARPHQIGHKHQSGSNIPALPRRSTPDSNRRLTSATILTMSNLAPTPICGRRTTKVEAEERKKGVRVDTEAVLRSPQPGKAWGLIRLGALERANYGTAKKGRRKAQGPQGHELWPSTSGAPGARRCRTTGSHRRGGHEAHLEGKLCSEFERWGLDPLDFHPKPGMDAIQMEHDVAEIIWRQEQHGFLIDQEKGRFTGCPPCRPQGRDRGGATGGVPPVVP